jgi:hypothetical protein
MSKSRIGIAILVVAAVLSSAALARGGGHGGGGHGGGGHGGGGHFGGGHGGGHGLAACISAVATTPVRGSPSHIHFLAGAFTGAVLLPVMAGGTWARYETPRCDPEASAAL